jgi:hypothetical protein
MVAENTPVDGFGRRWDGKNPDQTARGAPEIAKYRPEPPCFPGFGYSGCMPTITAFGEPHLASAPVWLLRQTIFIGLAAGAGAGAGAARAAAGGAAGAGLEQAPRAARTIAAAAKGRGVRVMVYLCCRCERLAARPPARKTARGLHRLYGHLRSYSDLPGRGGVALTGAGAGDMNPNTRGRSWIDAIRACSRSCR